LRTFKTNASSFLKIEKLSNTLGGIKVPLITISDFSKHQSRKKLIVFIARVRPCETHSSYVIEGLIDYLLGIKTDDEKSRSSASFLREKFIFKIVPLLNCDGAVLGNSRTSLSGNDLGRMFAEPDQYLH